MWGGGVIIAPGVGAFVPAITRLVVYSVPSGPKAIPSAPTAAYTATVPGPVAKLDIREIAFWSETNRSPLKGSVARPVARGIHATPRSIAPLDGLTSTTSPPAAQKPPSV